MRGRGTCEYEKIEIIVKETHFRHHKKRIAKRTFPGDGALGQDSVLLNYYVRFSRLG